MEIENNVTVKEKGFDLSLISKYKTQIMGLAILVICFFHFSQDFYDAYKAGNELVVHTNKIIVLYHRIMCFFGAAGVEVFLFLSGMGLNYSLTYKYNLKDFYKKRMIRIYIPYLLFAGIFWLVWDIFLNEKTCINFLSDLFFFSFFTDGTILFWYAGFIILLTLIFPQIFIFFSNKPMLKFIIFISVYILFLLSLEIFVPDFYKKVEIAFARVPVFLFGAVIAPWIRENRRMPLYLVIVSGILGLSLRFLGIILDLVVISRISISVYTLFILFVNCLFFNLVCKNKIINQCFLFLGKITLEIYMSHVALRRIFNYFDLKDYLFYRYLSLLFISVLFSYLYNKLFSITSKKIGK